MTNRKQKKIDPELGDPKLMLVRMRPGVVRKHSLTVPGGRTVDLENDVFYEVDDEALRTRLLEVTVDFMRPFDKDRNPKLFETIGQTAAIEEELAAKAPGLRPVQTPGSASKPKRIELPHAATVLVTEALVSARAIAEAAHASAAAADAHVAFLEKQQAG